MIERYPLTWPADKKRTPAADRQRAAFSKKKDNGRGWNENMRLSVADGADRVEQELDSYTKVGRNYRVEPNSIIISTNIPPTKKGRPTSGLSEPDDPGVAVYFTLDGINYCLPCDRWNRVADNLAAVAAHINALRGIERWGVGTSKDAYTGFKALPEKAGESSTGDWWQILQVDKNADTGTIADAHKRLVKHYHPDNIANGNRDMFDLVQKAFEQSKIKK